MPKETIIAGDVGGTNSRFSLFSIEFDDSLLSQSIKISKTPPGVLILHKKYENQNFESFTEVFRQFLKDSYLTKNPLTACIAVAGPVKDNTVRFTNRGWTIDGDEISKSLGIRSVQLVNDFVANGYGLLTLDEQTECVQLQQGLKQPNSPIACIGAGTGLGQCYLTPDKNGLYSCFPSEGGHAEFAPRNDLEVELLNFLKHKFSQKHRVSVERIVSGGGLVNIYEFLCSKYPEKVDEAIHEQFNNAGDLKAAIIARNRVNNELCKKTMDIFVTAYGAEAGVAALKWLPYGGLYLTGGLTPKNLDLLKQEAFLDAFLDKGRVSGMLCSIPIYVVLPEDLGVRGAHFAAFRQLRDICNVPTESPSSKHDNNFRDVNDTTPIDKWLMSLLTLSILSTVAITIVFTVGKSSK